MAKKNFKEQLQAQREAEKEARKDTVKDVAKGMLSDITKGEHRNGYKETTIKLRITEQEKEAWKQYAKGQPLSAFIRDSINYNIAQGVTVDDIQGGKE